MGQRLSPKQCRSTKIHLTSQKSNPNFHCREYLKMGTFCNGLSRVLRVFLIQRLPFWRKFSLMHLKKCHTSHTSSTYRIYTSEDTVLSAFNSPPPPHRTQSCTWSVDWAAIIISYVWLQCTCVRSTADCRNHSADQNYIYRNCRRMYWKDCLSVKFLLFVSVVSVSSFHCKVSH